MWCRLYVGRVSPSVSQTLIGHYLFPENPNTPLEHTPGIPWNNPKWFRNWTESLQLLVEWLRVVLVCSPRGVSLNSSILRKLFSFVFCLTRLVTFWRNSTQVTTGARQTFESFFAGVVFLKSGPHWQNIGLTYGSVTRSWCHKDPQGCLTWTQGCNLSKPKKGMNIMNVWHLVDTMLESWKSKRNPPIYVSKNVGENFRQPQPDDSLRYLEPLKFGHGPNGLGPQAISVGNFVERLLRGSRAIDAEAKTHRGFPIHPSEKVTNWPMASCY